ncbi:MAG: hypothetical protein ACR2NN_07685 [Bryobacteraceae bacterium]
MGRSVVQPDPIHPGQDPRRCFGGALNGFGGDGQANELPPWYLCSGCGKGQFPFGFRITPEGGDLALSFRCATTNGKLSATVLP